MCSWLMLLGTLFVAATSAVPLQVGDYPAPPTTLDCCFNGTTINHGKVAATFAENCLQLLCKNGSIAVRTHGDPGCSHCCEFNNRLYSEGEKLSGHCLVMTCTQGSWTLSSTIDNCCRHCYIHDDPHIYTFDDHRYDWHGNCNYSVAQVENSYDPPAGVFSDFEACYGLASCLGFTTFKDNPHTLISLDTSVFNIKVNGDPYVVPLAGIHAVTSSGGTHPVLVWRSNQCILLFGSSNIMIQHCRHRLDVWAHPSKAEHLDGLCGHFNFYKDDDFMDRSGQVHTLEYWPYDFPASWLTSEQSEVYCESGTTAHCSSCPPLSPFKDLCQASEEQKATYKSECEKFLWSLIARDESLSDHLDTCSFDLCMMYQDGRTRTEVANWLAELSKILAISLQLNLGLVMTENDTSLPPVTYTDPVMPVATRGMNFPTELGTDEVIIKNKHTTNLNCACVEALKPEVSSLVVHTRLFLDAVKTLQTTLTNYEPSNSLDSTGSLISLKSLKNISNKVKKSIGMMVGAWDQLKEHVSEGESLDCPTSAAKATVIMMDSSTKEVLWLANATKEAFAFDYNIAEVEAAARDAVGASLALQQEIKDQPC